ncbi:MFS transporter [Kocuria coralli]|uniref:MFS transporter n=1 Tax=Kocuria coralli TaxID=1461025 RepID=A0A5J5KXN6_9MICC|nr:MFS transporter [Kocuria coralli]KAA9394439.1 MFS transporter [Kocuria coralli]
MTAGQQTPPSPQRLKVARVAISGFFLVNGAVLANLLPRLPEVKDAFELTNTQFGFLVIAMPLGSILSGMAPAPLMRRFGSGPVAGIGSALLAALVAVASIAGGIGGGAWLLAAYVAPIALAGMLDAIVDTAQNAQAIDLQKTMGRSILNSMHAIWSLGAMLGGLMGSAAVALGVPLTLHLSLSGLLFAALALVAQRFSLQRAEIGGPRRVVVDPDDGPRPAPHAAADAPSPSSSKIRPVVIVVMISVIAIAGAMVEDLGINWSTLYLIRVLETPAAAAGMGLVAMMAAQFIGRLLGDPMVDRFGRVRMAQAGAAMAAAGVGVVAVAPHPAVAILGFALAGFGCATLVPSAFHAADSVPGLRPGAGLTLAGWLLRTAFLIVSPLVGVISDSVGLRLAILIVPLCALIAVLVSGALKERETAPATEEHAAASTRS